jgi:amino acid transporter
MFTVMTVLSLLVLAVVLTYPEFYEKTAGIRQLTLWARMKDYLFYLFNRSIGLFKSLDLKRLENFFSNRIVQKNLGWTDWLFYCLWGSSVYLILSGFFFAFFVPRGLSGLPLLLHVVAGGIFAVCLCAAVFIKARDYTLGSIHTSKKEAQSHQPFPADVPTLKVRILFWLITVSGFFLILTALTSMLPLFPLSTQMGLIDLHRYSALIGLLSSIAFIHFSPNGNG